MLFPILEMVVLLAIAGFLGYRINEDWQASKNLKNQMEYTFQWNRFRRRLQIVITLAVVAICVCLGQMALPKEVLIFIWSTALLIGMWLTILVLSDIVVTRKHYGTMGDIEEVHKTSLPGEIRSRKDRAKKSLSLREPSPDGPSQQKPAPGQTSPEPGNRPQ